MTGTWGFQPTDIRLIYWLGSSLNRYVRFPTAMTMLIGNGVPFRDDVGGFQTLVRMCWRGLLQKF
jgi:hypothetical protein